MKRILLIAATIVVLFASPVVADAPIRIMVDSEFLSQPGLMINGSVYVPLRAVSEKLGASAEWFPKTQTVLILPGVEPIVDGDANFKKVIAESMALLKTRDPAGYKMVCNNVREIEISDEAADYQGHGVMAFGKSEIMHICFTREGTASEYFVPQWVASLLVHESIHCIQTASTSRKANELEAYTYQLATLTVIGADQKYIDAWKSTSEVFNN